MEPLLASVKRLHCYDSNSFEEIIITGTGFSGSSRANLRYLCSKTGIKYCGDLMSGWTTHLVVNENNSNPESSSTKMQVAAKWGVPIVRLQWLLESIQQGEPLCEDPYLLHIKTTDTTPAVINKAVLPTAAAAARPQLSSKQDSNSGLSRTPLRSVENMTEQLQKLTVTPKASETPKPPAAAQVVVEIQEDNINEEVLASPSPTPPAATKSVSVHLNNSAEETPSASPPTTDIPSEMAVLIEEDPSPAPMFRPETEEIETEDDSDEVEMVNEKPETEIEIEDAVEIDQVEMVDEEVKSAVAIVAPPKSKAQWWDSQDSLWVPGSQPREIESDIPHEHILNQSFSFGVVADASDAVISPQKLLPPPTRPPSLPLPQLSLPRESPCASNSSTPMSDMTPLDIERPGAAQTRVPDSPSSCDGSDNNNIINDNNVEQLESYEGVIEQGGQAQPEWWEDDCSSVDDILDDAVRGCTPPRKVDEEEQNGIEEGGGDGVDDGEEPSPLSVAGSNHDSGIIIEDDATSKNSDLEESILLPQQELPPQQQELLPQPPPEESEIDDDYSENQVTARARAPLPPLPPLPSGSPQPADDAVPLKVLHRAPRGSTVKARYRLANTKTVTFAEQVHLRSQKLTLDVKDKTTAVILRLDSSSNPSSSSEEEESEDLGPILAEPISFYRCMGEDMQMEYYRLYTGAQALRIAESAGARLLLPPGFDATVELLKGITREHADMRRVEGTMPVRKTRLGVAPLKARTAQGGKPLHYWRCEFDADVPEVLIP